MPPAPQVYLIRHGETEWSATGRHTSVTDLALTERGREMVVPMRSALAAERFALVLTSPRQRALETCAIAGFAERAEVEDDLVEWNYGDYEGLTQQQIQTRAPGWMIFRDGCPNGEAPRDVAARVDRVIARIRALAGPALLFGHGHLFRVFAARWLDSPPETGSRFLLDPATLNILSDYDGIPSILRWNAPVPPVRQ